MTLSLLKDIYLHEGLKGDTPQRIALPSDDPIAAEVRRFPLICIPAVGPSKCALFNTSLFRSVAALVVNSVNYPFYARKSIEDLERIRILINKVASSEWAIELKALVIHNLLAFIAAYRSDAYFQTVEGRAALFTLPVWQEKALILKDCHWDRDINIFGGVTARVFVPSDKTGSPTYLLHGTLCWNCGNGAGITIIDDFNPFGVGETIRQNARQRLHPYLVEHKKLLGEKAVMIGQSLGGILVTALAIDHPDLISKAFAFGPPKPSLNLRRQWEQLENPPSITTFIGCYGTKFDPVPLIGELWLGRVFEMRQGAIGDAIVRHIHPVANSLTFEIHEIPIGSLPRTTTLWWIIQRIGATIIFCLLLPILTLKRLLFGWNTGGRWKYGLFGIPFQFWKGRSLGH